MARRADRRGRANSVISMPDAECADGISVSVLEDRDVPRGIGFRPRAEASSLYQSRAARRRLSNFADDKYSCDEIGRCGLRTRTCLYEAGVAAFQASGRFRSLLHAASDRVIHVSGVSRRESDLRTRPPIKGNNETRQ